MNGAWGICAAYFQNVPELVASGGQLFLTFLVQNPGTLGVRFFRDELHRKIHVTQPLDFGLKHAPAKHGPDLIGFARKYGSWPARLTR
jgi:hypothetical protein